MFKNVAKTIQRFYTSLQRNKKLQTTSTQSINERPLDNGQHKSKIKYFSAHGPAWWRDLGINFGQAMRLPLNVRPVKLFGNFTPCPQVGRNPVHKKRKIRSDRRERRAA